MNIIPKDEILDVSKKVCTTFTIQYTKAYTLALVKYIKREINKKPKPDWQLEARPVSIFFSFRLYRSSTFTFGAGVVVSLLCCCTRLCSYVC